MEKPRSHYDNLKVARNAPPEVIRAAYKALAQKFHPDRNPEKAEDCARIMTIINESFDALSDPVKREKHDQWLAKEDKKYADAQGKPQPQPQPPSNTTPQKNPIVLIAGHIFRNWPFYALITFAAWFWLTYEPPKPKPGPKPYQATPTETEEQKELANYFEPAKKSYVRPKMAPNGQPWPKTAGYVNGYPLLNANGLSTVTVDNTKNNSDVFVKLVFLSGAKAYPVRHVYIPAYSKRILNKVTTGSYDIRYQDLNSGDLSRSEAFQLDEIETYKGTQFSNMTITLYKVQDGNMETYSLPENEF